VSGRLGAEVGASASKGPLATAESLKLPDGAGLVLGGAEPWAHFITEFDRGLGAILLLADRSGATKVSIYSDSPLRALTRQAACFDFEIETMTLVGREPVPSESAPPELEVPTPDVAVLALSGTDVDGVRTVTEHGEAVAEVAGLEIARASVDNGELRVRVGVGSIDQDLAEMMVPGVASIDRIRAAATLVRQHRRPDAPPHPLQRVAPERWLRHRLVDKPQRWGFADLKPVSLLAPRVGLRLNALAAALGSRPDGSPALVVCSVGVNPELVPLAADLRQARHPDAELVLATPGPDLHAAIVRQANRLTTPVTLLTTPSVTRSWPPE